ncbi:hypothetical protein F5884DRAFT_798997, partial [Xylogone sp. PMI_703]
MASAGVEHVTIALIHNTALPHPLGVLSNEISAYSQQTYFTPNIPDNFRIQIIDLAEFNLSIEAPESALLAPYTPPEARKSLEDWVDEISKYPGLIFLFPYHTWSCCNPLKAAVSLLPQHVLTRKPVILMGFGREEAPSRPEEYGRTWKKKSLQMMKEFMEEKKMNVLDSAEKMPEFMIYDDYWPDWVTGGYNGFISGQQAEHWEFPAWNRCVAQITKMVKDIQSKKKF